jgi:hypothetical protein
MKIPVMSLVFLFASSLMAQQANPQIDPKLEATLNAVLRQFSARIDALEQRIRSLEDLPEVKIPRGIRGNLRQIDAALQQYCLEHKTLSVQLSDLVGPTKLIRELRSIDGETYDNLPLRLDGSEWSVSTPHGLTIIHKTSVVDPKQLGISK